MDCWFFQLASATAARGLDTLLTYTMTNTPSRQQNLGFDDDDSDDSDDEETEEDRAFIDDDVEEDDLSFYRRVDLELGLDSLPLTTASPPKNGWRKKTHYNITKAKRALIG